MWAIVHSCWAIKALPLDCTVTSLGAARCWCVSLGQAIVAGLQRCRSRWQHTRATALSSDAESIRGLTAFCLGIAALPPLPFTFTFSPAAMPLPLHAPPVCQPVSLLAFSSAYAPAPCVLLRQSCLSFSISSVLTSPRGPEPAQAIRGHGNG